MSTTQQHQRPPRATSQHPRSAADPRPQRRELLLVATLLALLTAAAFGPYVAGGGLYWDDWENAATTQHPPPGFVGPVELRLAAYRPGLALLLPLPHLIAGVRPGVHLAIAAGLVWLMVVCFYALLRTAGLPALHAIPVCFLALLFPHATATRLWPTGAVNNVALALMLVGLWAGLRALDRRGTPRAGRWRAAAIALPVLGVLTYEVVAAPALLGSLALYVHRLGWRSALRWWRPQAVAIGLAALINVVATTKEVQAPGTSLSHAVAIAEQGLVLLARSLAPFGRPPAFAVLATAAAVAVACALASRRGGAEDGRRALLATAWRLLAGGVGGVAVGYLMFVPSHPAYAPLNPGTADRVNLIAALGYALAAYGAVLGVGALAARVLGRRWRWGAAVACVLLFVLVAGGYALRGREQQRRWERAAKLQEPVLAPLRARAPDLPAGSTVFAFGHQRFAAPGVPVFATSWDLNGAIKALSGDPSLSAFPLGRHRRLLCRPTTVGPYPTLDKREARPSYGRAFLLVTATGRLVPIGSRERCLALRQAIARGGPR